MTVLPLAIEYTFWDERLPEALLRFGDAGASWRRDEPSEAAASRLESALVETMEELKGAAMARDAGAFRVLLRGGRGTGGMYGIGRWVRGMFTRRPVQRGSYGASASRRTGGMNHERRSDGAGGDCGDDLLVCGDSGGDVLDNLQWYRVPGVAGGGDARVAVLIPARNEERNIGACLESVLASRGVGIEVVVLDDASTDRTAEIVREIAAQDARVRVGARVASCRGDGMGSNMLAGCWRRRRTRS